MIRDAILLMTLLAAGLSACKDRRRMDGSRAPRETVELDQPEGVVDVFRGGTLVARFHGVHNLLANGLSGSCSGVRPCAMGVGEPDARLMAANGTQRRMFDAADFGDRYVFHPETPESDDAAYWP